MGVVYKAFDTRLERHVALKILRPGLMPDAETRHRIEREARAAAALNHPNICTIHDVGEIDPEAFLSTGPATPHLRPGAHFITMEFVEGLPLSSLIREGPMPARRAIQIATRIADGVGRAHQARIVHRDLKPDNVMIGQGDTVKILDFGLAKVVTEAGRPDPGAVARMETLTAPTGEGQVTGTLPYMSPEQVRGEPVDTRSDLFSLGVILYEMITGLHPFKGKSVADTLSAILRDEPAAASTLNASAPPALDQVISRCLCKEAGDRYGSSEELLSHLREIEQELTASTNLSKRHPEPSRPWRLKTAAAAAAIVVSLALLVWFPPSGWRPPSRAPGGAVRIRAVAVLPFENLSGDPAHEYFADGMTDSLISDLARSGSLRVISRTSVMRYKGTRVSLPQIAGQLRVDAVVEGSVIVAKDRVRITAQLIEAAEELNLWAETYDRDLRDVLEVQSEMARAIAREVYRRLTPQQEARLARDRPIDPDIYRMYLIGRYHWNKRTEEGLRKGLEQFQAAIDKAPDFALAWAGLADSYFVLASWGLLPADEGYPRAKAAALSALQLDGGMAEAHASLAAVLMDYELDWAGAEQEYRRALELNPSYATARQWHAIHLAAMGRHEEAIAEIERAQDIDPLSIVINANVGRHYYFARRYDEAVAACRKAIEMDAAHPAPHLFLGLAYEQKGMYAEAIEEFRKAIESSGGGGKRADLAHAYAVSGQRDKALKLLEELTAPDTRGQASQEDLALVYLAIGDKEEALNRLELAYRESRSALFFLKVDPRFDRLHDEPRYRDLLRSVGLGP